MLHFSACFPICWKPYVIQECVSWCILSSLFFLFEIAVTIHIYINLKLLQSEFWAVVRNVHVYIREGTRKAWIRMKRVKLLEGEGISEFWLTETNQVQVYFLLKPYMFASQILEMELFIAACIKVVSKHCTFHLNIVEMNWFGHSQSFGLIWKTEP